MMAKEEIKALHFGVKGLQRKKDMDTEKYKAQNKDQIKTVRSKVHINAELRRQLLRNYGFSVEPKSKTSN
jgi:hypothetical protein